MDVHQLIDFSLIITNQITYYSQVKKIIMQLEKTPLDLWTELQACGGEIINLADELDDDTGGGEARKTKFIGKHFFLLHKRSYSKYDMLDAISIYLRSWNTYRALRDWLTRPCSNTVWEYFGILVLRSAWQLSQMYYKRLMRDRKIASFLLSKFV